MDNPHVFDQVDKSTDFILVDDCAQYLSMGIFYDIITGSLTVNPKEQPLIYDSVFKSSENGIYDQLCSY